jgi:hypothetical protein
VTASALLDDLRRRGATARVLPSGKLRIAPATAVDEKLLGELRAHRDAIVEELLRRSETWVNRQPAPTLSQRGRMCGQCLRVDRCYPDGEGFVCPQCAEWEVRGCPSFTVLAAADEQTEAARGACLRCGSPWAMHGRPAAVSWTRVTDPDDAMPATVRFVVSRAREVARGVNP